jgi:hypothetical protein
VWVDVTPFTCIFQELCWPVDVSSRSVSFLDLPFTFRCRLLQLIEQCFVLRDFDLKRQYSIKPHENTICSSQQIAIEHLE